MIVNQLSNCESQILGLVESTISLLDGFKNQNLLSD